MKSIIAKFTGNEEISTYINGTKESIEEYYLGKYFNFGGPQTNFKDKMEKCISVEILREVSREELEMRS